MGGKSGGSTQQQAVVSIPPDVLARYNAVNARAEESAAQPFTPYSGEFVAPLSPTQQAGISNINAGQYVAGPYYQTATQALMTGAGQAAPYFDAATASLYGGNAQAAPLQAMAGYNIQQAQAGAQPYLDMATGLGLAGTQSINPAALTGRNINQYMSPYVNDVVNSTMANLRQQQGIEQSTLQGQQIMAGAYGGDRSRIAAANLARQQELATGQTVAGLYNQGYSQALSTAQQQQAQQLAAGQANRAALTQGAQQMAALGQQGFGQGMTAAQQQAALGQQLYGQGASNAQQLASLGQGIYGLGSNLSQGLAGLGGAAQQSALQGAQAQLAAGTVQQQTQQAYDQALYNQFLQQQGYPFQIAQFLANIAEGTGALSGQNTGATTSTTGPFFSDRRLKDDIETIGKTFDGQDIVRFKYKDEPGTRIGLIAQDVEKHHPEAVGLAGGFKTVDYDKATDAAAKRGHFAYGGASSEGGAVSPEMAGLGFAQGGSPTDDLMAQILNAHQGMYPFSRSGLYGQTNRNLGPYGTTLASTPTRSLPAPQLLPPPPKGPSASQSFNESMSTARNLGSAYKGISETTQGSNALGRALGFGKPTEAAGTSALRFSASNPNTVGDVARGFETAPEASESLGVAGATAPEALKAAANAASAAEEVGTEAMPAAADALPEIATTIMETLGSLFSDKRLKENVRPVGKTFDGQNVYSYNYKGDHRTQMGLMAQDVEKHHPDAVGLAGGFKTVNYDKATKEAADRGHFGSGGLADRSGYVIGGAALDPFNTPGSDSGLGAGMPYGVGGKDLPYNSPDPIVPENVTKPADPGKLQAEQKKLAEPSNAMKQQSGGGGGMDPGAQAAMTAAMIAAMILLKDGGAVKDPREVRHRPHHRDGGSEPGLNVPASADAPAPDQNPDIDRYLQALRHLESSGRYHATGPEVTREGRPSDRAYGAYQVMGENIGPWSEAALGRRLTPEQFLSDTNAQDAVARHRFGQYLNQQGNPYDAASMWFSGRPIANAGEFRDALGTTVPAYVDRFRQVLGESTQPAPSRREHLANIEVPRAGLAPPSDDRRSEYRNLMERHLNPPDREPRDWMQRNQEWLVPVLTGLGTMAASPSRYLGSALLQGLAGGAGSYAGMQQRGEEQERQRQQMGIQRAQALIGARRAESEEQKNALELLQYFEGQFERRYDPITRSYAMYDKASNRPISTQEYSQRRSEILGSISSTPRVGSLAGRPAATEAAAPLAAAIVPPAVPAAVPARPEATTPQPAPVSAQGEEAVLSTLRPEHNPRTWENRAEEARRRIEGYTAGNQPVPDALYRDEAEARAMANRIRLGEVPIFDVNGNPVNYYQRLSSTRQMTEQDIKKAREEAGTFAQSVDTATHMGEELARVYGSIETNRATPLIANTIGVLRSIPGLQSMTPDFFANLQEAVNTGNKTAITQAFSQIQERGVNRAPATALREMLLTVADPAMDPAARYRIITNNLAELHREDALQREWMAAGTPDPVAFRMQWNRQHPVNDFIQEVRQHTPAFRGMTQEQIDNLRAAPITDTRNKPAASRPAQPAASRQAELNGRRIEVRNGQWVYSDTGEPAQ
jgi:hypothetical protein